MHKSIEGLVPVVRNVLNNSGVDRIRREGLTAGYISRAQSTLIEAVDSEVITLV